MTDRYLEPNQAQIAAPTPFEIALGDTIEAAYAAGVHDIDELVARLRVDGPPPLDGGSWTTEKFAALMADLGR